MTAAAALVLGITAPGAVGIAAADDRPIDARSWGLSTELQQNERLVIALQSARDAYRSSALSARTAFRTAVEGIQETITDDTSAQRADARAAGDAYRAVLEGAATGDLSALKLDFVRAWNTYRDALIAARATARPAMDTAAGSAKATLMTARSIHTNAVNVAFADYAPGISVPRALQDPSTWMGMSDSRWLGQGLDGDR